VEGGTIGGTDVVRVLYAAADGGGEDIVVSDGAVRISSRATREREGGRGGVVREVEVG